MKAYAPAIGPEMPPWFQEDQYVALILNEYHLRNLRWLLAHIYFNTIKV